MNETTLRNEFRPDIVFHPGMSLQEMIDAKGMSQAELSLRMGRPKKTINGIIKGEVAITSDTALQLERVVGMPASFWNNMESLYQDFCARQKEQEILAKQTEWLKGFPVRAMIKMGWIPESKDKTEQLQIILSYFGVASPEQWSSGWGEAKIAFRRTDKEINLPVVSAWLREGEIRAQNARCAGFDEDRFRQVLQKIRALTTEPPEIFEPELKQLCAEAGVVVVLLKQLPKTMTSGAAYWISKDKAVIQLSLRYKTNDHFWFSFFHEAAHILLHGKRPIYLDWNRSDKSIIEEEANKFASNFLIPKNELDSFLGSPQHISLDRIKGFAQEIGISPGIIVGRLQHDNFLSHKNGNRLKVRFVWKE
jgi:HTH-type transcriptional regulator/antitoxin HigA